MSEAQTETAPAAGGTILAGTPADDPRGWLPQEYRADPTFKDLADVNALAKGYKHAASLVGVDKAEILRIPREGEIPPEVFARLGRPENPDGYGFKTESVPAEVLGGYAKAAHDAGLSKAQADKLLDFYAQGVGASTAAQAEAKQAALLEGHSKVKAEWGAAYEERSQAVVQLMTQRGVNLGVLDEMMATDQLPVLNLLADAAGVMLEKSGLKGGGTATGGGAMTPEQAKGKINDLMRDSAFVATLQNREAPGNADAKRQWDELHEWAYAARG